MHRLLFVFLDSRSLYTASINVSIEWWFSFSVTVLFFLLRSFKSFSCSLSLKYPFSFILWKKLFKSYLSFVLLYTSSVVQSLRFCLIVYIFLEKGNLLKFITFPEGSCWYWIDFSIVLRSLLRFSLFLSRSSVHLKFLPFVFGLHWGRPELIFFNVSFD